MHRRTSGEGRHHAGPHPTTGAPWRTDDDRILYSLDMSWTINSRLAPDAAYQRITIDDPTVDVLSSSGSRLTGSFDGSANLFAVGVNYKF